MPKLGKLSSTLVVSALVLFGCGGPGESGSEQETTSTGEEMREGASSSTSNEVDSGQELSSSNGNNQSSEDSGTEVAQDIRVWFPQLEDTLLEYEGEGNEFASFTRYPQFIHDNTVQMVDSTGGTDVVTIYEYSDDEVREIFIRPETYFREDFADTGLESEQEGFEVILQLPIEEGHSWQSPSGSTSEITGVDVEKETPSGMVSAIEVTRTFEDSETVDYYGEEIGLIERVTVTNSTEDEVEVSSTLSSVQEDTPEEFPLTVYSMDDQAMGLDSHSVTMKLYTDDPARFAMEDILKGRAPGTDSTEVIEENVSINFMYLRQDGVVHVDFSANLAHMNAGSGIEAMILQGIVNTIGGYYNVQEVLITLDGEPYESGHIFRGEGETWSVDHSNVNE